MQNKLSKTQPSFWPIRQKSIKKDPQKLPNLLLQQNNGLFLETLVCIGEKLKVTAADNSMIAWYEIISTVGFGDPVAELIKIYPNPTTDRVVIQGFAKGNRVRVFNSTGITLCDVTVNNSTEYVSLAGQPAGIYVFVISSGEKFINIQKIIKK